MSKEIQDKLNSNSELIFTLLEQAESYRDIAARLQLKSTSALSRWLSKSEHSARADMALKLSAEIYTDKAEEVLKEIEPDSSPIAFQRARELAQFYKWKSGKRNPGKYGDRVDISHEIVPGSEIIIKGQKFANNG